MPVAGSYSNIRFNTSNGTRNSRIAHNSFFQKEKKMSNGFYKKRSLGGLRKVSQTNPKAPPLVGSMAIEAETLKVLVQQLNESGGDKVISNLAAWVNRDASGKFLTVEISPRYAKKQMPPSPRNTLEQFLSDEDDD
jgi:hypothetical protein